MSLQTASSTYGGGGMTMSAMSLPMGNMNSNTFNNTSSSASGVGSLSSAATEGYVNEGNRRNGKNGSKCYTLLVNGHSMTVSYWNEEQQQCHIVPTLHSVSVSCSKEQIVSVANGQIDSQSIDIIKYVPSTSSSRDSDRVNIIELIQNDKITMHNTVISTQSLFVCIIRKVCTTMTDSSSSSKSKKPKKQSLNIVLPDYVLDDMRNSNRVKSHLAGVRDVKNIFPLSVATTAGLLLMQEDDSTTSTTATGASGVQGNANVLQAHLHSCVNNRNDSVVLFLYDTTGVVNGITGTLITCENSADAIKTGNLMGFSRIAIIETLASSTSQAISDIHAHMSSVITSRNMKIGAVVTSVDLKAMTVSVVPSDIHVFTYDISINSAAGGCLLAVGELDSSRQFITGDDGRTKIAYQFAIYDGYCSREIVMETKYDDDNSSNTTTIEVLFKKDSRLWKSQIGLLRVGDETPQSLSCTRNFKWKSSYISGFPSVRILQKNKSNGYEELGSIKPLEVDGETYTSCDITVHNSPHTTCTKLEVNRGSSLKDKHRTSNQLMVIAGIVLSLLLSFLVIQYGYPRYQEYQQHNEMVDWVSDFYSKHSPDKLSNRSKIDALVNKHKSNYFVLWRQLEKKYHVKVSPPRGVVDDL